MYRKASEGINQTFFRLRLIVLIALTTGMRIAEIFGLKWSDVYVQEGLIAVRAKLKGGKMRYVPMPSGTRERVQAVSGRSLVRIGSFRRSRERSGNDNGWTRVSRPPGIGRDPGLPISRSSAHVRILVHDERRRSLRTRQDPGPLEYQDDRALRQTGKKHIARTGSTAREMWKLMEERSGSKIENAVECSRIVPLTETRCFWLPLSSLECGGQGRNRTADASLFRAALYQLSYLAIG